MPSPLRQSLLKIERKAKNCFGEVEIPVSPMSDIAVNLCALSAHTRPTIMTLSNVEIFAPLALAAASLRRLTFSCGVSLGSPVVRGDADLGGPRFVIRVEGFVDTWGDVDVNRVASMADRAMLEEASAR